MDDSKKIKNPSLKVSIRKMMIILTLVYAILSMSLIGYLSFQEARESQDNLLIEISNLVQNGNLNLQDKLEINESEGQESDEAIIVFNLISKSLPQQYQFLQTKKNGIYSLTIGKFKWRVFLSEKTIQNKVRFFVAQRTEVRDEYAWNNCLSFIAPTLILLILLILSVSYIINYHFRSLEALGEKIAGKRPVDMEPVSQDGVFVELLPFLNSINGLLSKTKEYLSNQNLFIANAAHELRTPITAISLQVENLVNSEEGERLERQEYILSALDRLRKMVGQLLDMAKIDRPDEGHFIKSSFLGIIKNVIEVLYPIIEQKNINIEVHHSKDLYILNQPGELECLIKNAIENAIKFSRENANIEVTLGEQDNKAFFTVENFHVYMSEEQINKLSNPFYKVNQEKEGSGLGLAICNKISEKLGGRLEFKITDKKSFKFIYSQSIVK